MHQNEIECMYFGNRFTSKPQGSTVGWVQKELKAVRISIKELAESLCKGASFKPAVLQGGRKAENWSQQQLFGLDFDDGTTIEETYNKVVKLGIKPCFVYTTFSHTEDHHKFRMIFCNSEVITDGTLRDKLQATLMGVVGGVDEVCFNRDRLFFGGCSGVVLFPAYDKKIDAEHVIKQYWKDSYNCYIPNITSKTKLNKKPIVVNKKTSKPVEKDNTDLICMLDVEALKKRLKDREQTNKEGILYQSAPDTQKTIFDSEAELYEYINSIDLREYLGVSHNEFSCILPTHRDSNPSAHIYVTDDGTQIFKCFGCGQARTIVSITEQLAKCKRHEAIEFIKKVYDIDYRKSEWIEQQRKILIDSALYLDSQEFKETFPKINQLIRTRKADIQKILFHMTKYVRDGLELEGKPLFFASYTTLMGICETNNKSKVAQSLTLFTLLKMLDKVSVENIPQPELKKAQAISAKYGFKKITNFYQIEEYGYTTLEESERRAQVLIDNNMTLKGLSREYVLRTFGSDVADEVFPQYKQENQQGTSEKSDTVTMELAGHVLAKIQEQGYMLEKELNQKNRIGVQWKKSIQEILNCYGLKRVKLNKELKKAFGIEGSGYPNIIIKDEGQCLEDTASQETNKIVDIIEKNTTNHEYERCCA